MTIKTKYYISQQKRIIFFVDTLMVFNAIFVRQQTPIITQQYIMRIAAHVMYKYNVYRNGMSF